MRRSDKEIKAQSEMEEIMKKSDACRIGLCDGSTPYVVPVNFGFKDNKLYFHSAKEGRKLDIIRRNNAVCFEMDADHEFIRAEKGCKWGMKYRSVIGNGKAFFVEDPAEKIAALKIIVSHYADKEYDFSEADAATVTVIRIDIESVSGKKSGY